MEESINMKNNLIQNFYVIGVPFEEITSYVKSTEILYKSKSFIPQILTKFPKSINNFNRVLDQFIVEHCFPNNFFIKKGKTYENFTYHFEFELDNQIYQFLMKNKCLYSKIHFTCFKFYESVINYLELSNHINNTNKKDINDENLFNKYELFYIPKVICFASLLPFPDEMNKILTNIYDLYKFQNYKNKCIISYPIEKIIEQIIMSLPIPIMNDYDILLTFKMNSLMMNLTYKEIIFSSYKLRDYHFNKSYDLDMKDIFINNAEETIIYLYKNIILENPILFFCEYKQYLTSTIESFLNILTPLKYVYPCITILPSKFYGLINSQDKFIFGINQRCSKEFFSNNNIKINKNILIVSIEKNEQNELKIYFQELLCKEGERMKYILLNLDNNNEVSNQNNNPFNIDLPMKYVKKLAIKLKNYLTNVRNNMKKNIFENNYVFRCTIINIFQKFLINVLSGYTKYLLKNPNHNYFGFNIFYKNKEKHGDFDIIKEIFNYEEFLLNIPKDNLTFYREFFNTKIFYNFIKEIIYPNNEIDSLKHKYFDFLTFLKKDKVNRKSEAFFEQYQKYKMPFEQTKNLKNIKIIVSDDFYFNDSELDIINKSDKNKIALKNYYQLITKKGSNSIKNKAYSIKYFIFPKLLFDDNFFDINYTFQFYRHYIDLPSDNPIKQFNTFLEESENEFLSKCCFIIYQSSYNNSSSPNLFELYSYDYIELNWLLLCCCSLWYCNSNKELDIRINKIFDVIDKLEYIEEYVLYFIFYSIYKYGDIPHFLRIFEIFFRFVGYNSYSNLLLLFDKLKEGRFNLRNNDKDNNIKIPKRSLIDIKKYEINDKAKEEIIFNNEQKCEKCGNIMNLNDQDISVIINKKIDKTKNISIYKCKKCDKVNLGIKINYQVLLVNIKEYKEKLISNGSFNLLLPHLLFIKLKDYLTNLKDNKLDINHIFSNNNIDILNYIFYFSLKSLPFDFLFPYENSIDNNEEEKEYFFNYDYIEKKGIKKFENISPIINEKFILNVSNNK